MKRFIFLSISACLITSILFAQDKQVNFKINEHYLPFEMLVGSDNCFYLVCAQVESRKISAEVLFKFDAELTPVWKEPVVLNRQFSLLGALMGMAVEVFPYTNPADGSTIEYLFRHNDVFQIMPDGTAKEMDIKIPEKEMKKKLAATFTDANGLNIITLAGDETFLTGVLNWYTYAHGDLAQTKRTITLPLPTQIDKDNESGWRLSDVTSAGLYFYYVSYKNKVKDETRPILACHIVHVGHDGKVGEMIDIDLGLKEYKVIPADYENSSSINMKVYKPVLFETGNHVDGSGYSIPTDVSYMGVKIDEPAKRIYTIAALNDELKVGKDGTASGGALGKAMPAKSVFLNAFDFTGKRIYQLSLKYTPPKLGVDDDWGRSANKITINPLPENEGIICRLINNGVGDIWAINDKGEMTRQIKSKPFTYKEMTVKYHHDIFTSNYYSLKDLINSPYALKEKSGAYQCFEKLDEKAKRDTYYASLKGVEILAVWDEKENNLQLNSFTKNKINGL